MKNRVQRIIKHCITTTLGLFLVTLQVNVNANVISTNDLKLSDQTGVYSVTGNDPYVIFKPSVDKQVSGPIKYLIFDEALSHKQTDIQLFFKPERNGFSPQYFLEFKALSGPFSLRVPDGVEIDNKRLRIDFEQCNKCLVTFSNIKLSSKETVDQIIDPKNTQNGSLQIDNVNGLNIDLSKWSMNDLDGDTSSFNISGLDPYMASQPLNVSTTGLAGVYFKLIGPEQSSDYSDFQLFYATENNPFNALYSSIARLYASTQVTTQKRPEHEIEIFFPLEYLSAETPKDQILKRIRLDIPLNEGNWSLKESRLIHSQQWSQYSLFLPKQLLQYKRQRLTGKALAKKVVTNVFTDKGFIIFWLCLLALVITVSVKAYRK